MKRDFKKGYFIIIEEILGKFKNGPDGEAHEPVRVLAIKYRKEITEPNDEALEYIKENNINTPKNLRIYCLEFRNPTIYKFSKETKVKLKSRYENKKEGKDAIKALIKYINHNCFLTKEEQQKIIEKMGTGKTGLCTYYYYSVATHKNSCTGKDECTVYPNNDWDAIHPYRYI